MGLFTLKQRISRPLIIALLLPVLLALPQLLISSHGPQLYGLDSPSSHPLLVSQSPGDTDHPHSHGDVEPSSSHQGHWHGHNPTDHSHGSAYPAVQPQHHLPSAGCGFNKYESVCSNGHSHPPERPPKVIRNS